MDIRKFFGSSGAAPKARGLCATQVKTAPKKRPVLPPKPKQPVPKRTKTPPKPEPRALRAPAVVVSETPKPVSGLWPDKYRPRRSQDLVGNEAAIRSLAAFLKGWSASTTPPATRAALLSGPPGVGKTSAATILCREAGFHAVENFAPSEGGL